MGEKIRIVYKNKGQTPLDCIINLRKDEPSLAHIPITYAGRLDPLAHGVILLLLGDECQKKDEYLKLEKVYEVEILFGLATDTYDVMGKVVTSSSIKLKDIDIFKKILKNFTGKIKQKYPVYSSRPVQGKPLFMWAREGKLNEIEIPSHDVFVESIDLINENFIDGKDLLKKIKNDISLVRGDFRQDEILKLWEEKLKDKEGEKYKTIRVRIKCGSGFYARALANDIGEALGTSALALEIKRTKIGNYSI